MLTDKEANDRFGWEQDGGNADRSKGMRRAVAGTIRHLGLIAVAVVALGWVGAGWAQQAQSCKMAQASACTDQKVVECLNQHKGNQTAISQCQMKANMDCYTANGCPTSAS
jgi:uncharacterized protein HemX